MKKMKLDLSKVEFSGKDLEKSIKIPSILSPELSEIIGLHVGYGYLGYRKTRHEYVIQCMGNPKVDRLHYDNYISALWKLVFNIELDLRDYPNKCYGFRVYSKAIGTYFTFVLGLPNGKKSLTIGIPYIVKKTCGKGISGEMIACIRGIIDTDFYLTNDRGYLELGAWFGSKKLVLDLYTYLKKVGIQPKIYLDIRYFNTSSRKFLVRHQIRIRKKEDIGKWLISIGTNNPKFYKIVNNSRVEGQLSAPVV